MFYRKRVNRIQELGLASLAGLATGTLLGLLLASDKGAAIRKKVNRKSEQYLKAIRKEVAEFSSFLNARAEATKRELDQISRDFTSWGEVLTAGRSRSDSYEDWTRKELLEEAETAGIEGHEQMYKDELILALRNQ